MQDLEFNVSCWLGLHGFLEQDLGQVRSRPSSMQSITSSTTSISSTPYTMSSPSNAGSQAASSPLSADELRLRLLAGLAMAPAHALEISDVARRLGWADAETEGAPQERLAELQDSSLRRRLWNFTGPGCQTLQLTNTDFVDHARQALQHCWHSHYEGCWRATSKTKEVKKPLLTAAALRQAVDWPCDLDEFTQWLIRTGQGCLLHGPTPDAQFICTAAELAKFVQFTSRQKDNLTSVECFRNADSDQVSLLRIVSPTRQVHVIDLLALRTEARSAQAPPDAGAFVESLRELMEGSIRKCGWDLAAAAVFWRDVFGIAVHNAIELLPCCAAYFPAEVNRFPSRSDATCARGMADILCPEMWEEQPRVTCEVDWDRRPLTTEMEYLVCHYNVGMLLDMRKAIRARVMKKMEDQMAFVSQRYLAHGDCFAATRILPQFVVCDDGEPCLADTLTAMELARCI
eukprot:GGOE01002136.1.p1 GENE.GGOE01002136.1~~GGOE01002136.1.p1  ORF type:complete len:470 (-),score=119.17 GGOE01002136.1:398-1774(-)